MKIRFVIIVAFGIWHLAFGNSLFAVRYSLLAISPVHQFTSSPAHHFTNSLTPQLLNSQTPKLPNFEDLWKQVDSLSTQGLPKSALEIVEKIYQKAKKEKNDPQLVKSILYRIKLESTFREDVLVGSINEVKAEIRRSNEPVKQILSSVVAELYWKYYQANRYRFNDRSLILNNREDSIRTWDLTTLSRKTIKTYMLSLENPDLLKKIPVTDFAVIIESPQQDQHGDKDKKSLLLHKQSDARPTLYDFLCWRALDYFSGQEGAKMVLAEQFKIDKPFYFSQAPQFAVLSIPLDSSFLQSFAIHIFCDLVSFHLIDKEPLALIDLELHRFEFVREHSVIDKKDSLYLDALRRLEEKHLSSPWSTDITFAIAQFHYDKGGMYVPKTDTLNRWELKYAVESCEKAIKRFPESNGAKNCSVLKERILEPSLRTTMEEAIIPEKPALGLLEFRNLKTIYFRIIKADPDKVTDEDSRLDYDTRIRNYAGSPILKSWSQVIPADSDYQQHRMEYALPALPPGFYILLTSSGNTFNNKKEVVAFTSFYATHISYISQRQDNGTIDMYALDRENGTALENVSAEVFRKSYDYRQNKFITLKIGNGVTDKDGFFSFSYDFKGDYSNAVYVRFTIKEEQYRTNTIIPVVRYNNEKSSRQTFFFTDRSIYRPGQTIYFKGIVVEKKGDLFRILPGVASHVIFRDANWQQISETNLTTNEFGSFNGSFIAPQGVLLGQMTISDSQGSVSVSVEEYKRPTFEVIFNPLEGNYKLNDSINVVGNAKAFAGNNLDGASVTYRVVRMGRFPFFDRWSCPFRISPQVEITNGITTTGSDGTFKIDFKALPDLLFDKKSSPVFDYFIYADITDINGETQSGQTSVSIGYISLLVSLNIPEKLNLAKDSVFKLKTTNLNDRFTPAQVTVKMERLLQPDRFFKSRIAQEPDLFSMTREEFYSKFPNDVYGDDNNPSKWTSLEKIPELLIDTKNDSLLNVNHLSSPTKLKQGFYRLTLTSKDPFGETVESKSYFTIYDPDSKEIPLNVMNWFVPVKAEGVAGDKAKFLIGSGEKNIHLLYEIRVGDSLLSRKWINLNGNQQLVEVPIRKEYGENFKVDFSFVRHNRGFQNTQVVQILNLDKKLNIIFESFRNKLLPGQEEEWKIQIKTALKKAVNAEFLAAMYDVSLDQFRPHNWDFQLINYRLMTENWDAYQAFGASSGNTSSILTYKNFLEREYDQLNWFGFTSYGGSRFYKGSRMKPMAIMESDVATNALPLEEKSENVAGITIADSTSTSVKKTTNQPSFLNFPVRKDFRETAFFYPSLVTDSSGNLMLHFTVPESLTKWKMMGFAHTRDLANGMIEKELITQKDLMVFPNVPRFVRQGDTVVFSAKVVNLSDRSLVGNIKVEIKNALNQQYVPCIQSAVGSPQSVVSSWQIDFQIGIGQSIPVSWKLIIPDDPELQVLQYRIMAQAGNFSDGEEKAIPVLTNRMLVTESLPLPVRGKGDFNFTFDKLLRSVSGQTLRNYRLTLEFASNPAWYAIQALPYLDEPKYPNADNIFNAYYCNKIAMLIANSDPKIRQVFESWKNLTPDALLSNLEKNRELKSALLQETPWVREAKNESERKQRIGLLFDLNTLKEKLDLNLKKLQKMQKANGAWAWFDGMPESRYITQNIVTGLGHLHHLENSGSNALNDDYSNMLVASLGYIDREIVKDYQEIKKHYPDKLNEDHLSATQIQYLYARSYFMKDIPSEENRAQGIKEAFDYFKHQAEKYWLKNDLYLQGMIALSLNRLGNKEVPLSILRSFSEKALHSREMGMYWAMEQGYYWYQAPIETQAMMIEAYDEITADRNAVEEMKIWLLKQKQTQDWKTAGATVEACYALLLRGTDLLSDNPGVKIRIGNEKIEPEKLRDTKTEAGTGFFQVAWNGKEITPDMGNIKVSKSGDGVAWGAVYWQYFENLDKITPAQSPLKITKEVYVERLTPAGLAVEKITNYELRITNGNGNNSTLTVGDKLKVRLVLTVDRNLEFVHLKDMRASALEPGVELSGYHYQDGLGYYQTMTDLAANFFFDYLPKGTWVFEYPLKVNAAGDYSEGIATVQCMYAPEFSAHSEGIRILVEK